MIRKILIPLKKTVPGLIALVLLFIYYLILKWNAIEINYSSSMPLGFYQRETRTQIKRGDIVAVCLPKSIAAEGLKRGYLDQGDCPSGATPVLKQVIALPQDTVRLTLNTMTVHGISYFAPYQGLDHQGHVTRKWIKNGIYHKINGFWLYGAHDPVCSWDSRYYGAIASQDIRGVFKPLLTL